MFAETIWPEEPGRDQNSQEARVTPFELDCQKKAGNMMEFRDARRRRATCICGVSKPHHELEEISGRCRGFRAMNEREWAEWLGVDIATAPEARRRSARHGSPRVLFAPRGEHVRQHPPMDAPF
jgi:hypothetical protein